MRPVARTNAAERPQRTAMTEYLESKPGSHCVKGLIQYKKTKISSINYGKGNTFSSINKNGGGRGKYSVERKLFFLNKKKIKKYKDNKKDNE
ncbi:hypothetical protein PFDG_05239, partial [Plasmodium falciparum Dd2]